MSRTADQELGSRVLRELAENDLVSDEIRLQAAMALSYDTPDAAPTDDDYKRVADEVAEELEKRQKESA